MSKNRKSEKKAEEMEKGEATTKGMKSGDTPVQGKPDKNPEDAAHVDKIARIAGDGEDKDANSCLDDSDQADDGPCLSLSSDDGELESDSGSHANEEDEGNGGKGKGNDTDNDNDGDNDNDKSGSIDPQNVIFLGLRVYTNRGAAAVVDGQLRHEMATSFDGLAIHDR